jgi:hypothetical protein
MRLRFAPLRRNPELAVRLKQQIATVDGVERAEVSSLTGSILIHYRIGVTDGDLLLTRIREAGSTDFGPPAPLRTSLPRTAPSFREASPMERALVRLILQSVAQVAIERSLAALAAAIF